MKKNTRRTNDRHGFIGEIVFIAYALPLMLPIRRPNLLTRKLKRVPASGKAKFLVSLNTGRSLNDWVRLLHGVDILRGGPASTAAGSQFSGCQLLIDVSFRIIYVLDIYRSPSTAVNHILGDHQKTMAH
jgi:hypothetical protein